MRRFHLVLALVVALATSLGLRAAARHRHWAGPYGRWAAAGFGHRPGPWGCPRPGRRPGPATPAPSLPPAPAPASPAPAPAFPAPAAPQPQ